MTLRIKHALSSHNSFQHFFLHTRDSYSKSFVFLCFLGSGLCTLILETVVLPIKIARALVWTLCTPETAAGVVVRCGVWFNFDAVSFPFYMCISSLEWVGRCWVRKRYLWLPESFRFSSNKGPTRTSSSVSLWSTSGTVSQCEPMDSHFCGSKSHDTEEAHNAAGRSCNFVPFTGSPARVLAVKKTASSTSRAKRKFQARSPFFLTEYCNFSAGSFSSPQNCTQY